MNQSSPENRAPRETDCGNIGSAEPFGPWRRPMSTSVHWTETTIELSGVREGGMSGRNEQRKPGTTRGSPRRSRTAKASRISRRAVKSRCACEWDGWGRLSDDGPGHYNPDPSEDPWGGGLITLQGGARSSLRPDTVQDTSGALDFDTSRVNRTAFTRRNSSLKLRCSPFNAHRQPAASGISQSFNIRSASARLVADPGSNSVSAACRRALR